MLIACDFDGTITSHDCLHLIVQRYAPDAWNAIEQRLRSGEIGLVAAIQEEFRHVRVEEEEVVAFVMANAGVRPGFSEFVAWVESEGHRLMVVSSGFRVLIDPVLRAAGLSRLEVHAGDAFFSLEGTRVVYPATLRDCAAACGTCKSDVISAATREPDYRPPLVHIGDGLSDLCAAREADIVFARANLAVLLTREGLRFHPFESFLEVRDTLRAAFSGVPE
ncbi:MAG: MtnX-like HAD-IB family phosphatase [Gaiellales bacterium]|nr:MtnX-like HAD-IB family phosphatase [Gaiellales bacterium]